VGGFFEEENADQRRQKIQSLQNQVVVFNYLPLARGFNIKQDVP